MKLIFILSLLQVVTARSPVLVTLPTLGKIEGDYKTSLNGQEFFCFEGVPYARPPVGKYRFREPVPLKLWHGTFQAKTIHKCMQYYQYTPPGGDFVIGNEDCLYLNIYTPTLDPNANLDVIFYIHGGAFMFNWCGIYQPDYLLDQNLVLITVNYRLGPLGFLSTEDNLIPGNNGLKDQIQALKWVNENIKSFGGNPNSVTIFGMSAGGASVHFHYLSPKSRNLFHRGISQSGTMLNPWVLAEQPLEKTKQLATILGCDTSDLKWMTDCLKKRPARQIVAAVKNFQPWLYNPFSPFGVVVDSWANDPVLPQHPYQLLKEKRVADLPWIASYTNSEGLYPAAMFYSDDDLNTLETRWNELMPFILDYNYTVKAEDRDFVSERIRKEYLGGKSVNKKSFLDFVKIITDRIFVVDIEKSVRMQVAATTAPVYMYYFTYRGAHSKSEAFSGTDLDFRASHGDDTSYIFKMNLDTATTKNDRLMIKLLTEMVGTFAKSRTPKVGTKWTPVSKNDNNLKYLHISSPEKLVLTKSNLDATFWESLPIQENDKLFVGIKDEL